MVNYKPTAIVVDDSKAFAMYISLVLQRLGFDAVPARNNTDTLLLLKVMRPDMVIVDAGVRESDGITAEGLVSAIEHISNIPVILTHEASDKRALKACTSHSHFGHIQKPINIVDFHTIIQKCVTFSRNVKRKFLRTTLHQKVRITDRNRQRDYYAISLSEGGIFVRAVEPMPVGSCMTVTLNVKNGEALHLKGEVIYHNEVCTDVFRTVSGMAITFSSLTAKQRKMLKEYILWLLIGDILEEHSGIFTPCIKL